MLLLVEHTPRQEKLKSTLGLSLFLLGLSHHIFFIVIQTTQVLFQLILSLIIFTYLYFNLQTRKKRNPVFKSLWAIKNRTSQSEICLLKERVVAVKGPKGVSHQLYTLFPPPLQTDVPCVRSVTHTKDHGAHNFYRSYIGLGTNESRKLVHKIRD